MKHAFLLWIGVAFAAGWSLADASRALADVGGLRASLVFVALSAAGATLPLGAVWRALRRPGALVAAVGTNLLGLPALTFVAWRLAVVGGGDESIGGGVFVVGLVPCTLASAVIWTRMAGGDESVALLTTAVTNLLCVATVPAALSWAGLVGEGVSGGWSHAVKLLATIALPLSLAAAFRLAGGAAAADRHRTTLTRVGQGCILVMVFLGAGRTAGGTGWGDIVLAVALSAVVHAAAVAIGFSAAGALGADRPGRIAAGIAGGQKTLVVGLQIAIDAGVSVVPMLAYHTVQLIMDTVLATRLQSPPPASEAPPPASGAPPAGRDVQAPSENEPPRP